MLTTATDWLIFSILLAAYAIGCYYILTVRIDCKKVGGLLFIRIGRLQVSFCLCKSATSNN